MEETHLGNTPAFDVEKSPLREMYLMLGAKNPRDLFMQYLAEDQKLMRTKSWDYKNPDLVINKVKDALAATDIAQLSEEEKYQRQEILWFWYHHAISCAVGKYKDKQAAQEFAAKALANQREGHPNHITNLLHLLVNDKIDDAEQWAAAIPEDHEKSTATSLIDAYKQGFFFK